MAKLNFKNKRILITGASSGLGKEIARILAYQEEAHLIIAARRLDKLKELQKEIELNSKSKVTVIRSDLGRKNGPQLLFDKAVKLGKVDAIINNAGMTCYGKTDTFSLIEFETIFNVNTHAAVNLSYLFLKYFLKKKSGAILNITSQAAFLPVPYQSVYAASKHATQAFTEALYQEYKKSGIVISSFAPGGIATEMITKSGLNEKFKSESRLLMSAEKAAKLAIKGFKKKKYCVIPGIQMKMTNFVNRFIPRKCLTSIAAGIYKPRK